MPTLLAIDDDRSVLHLITHAFKDTPVTVVTARDVNEGLDVVRKKADVVLLDIMLPEISGLEAARKFQALDPKLPVIFITASGTSDTAIEAMKLGAYDYLLKPLDLPNLRDLVTRALEIRRLMKVPVELLDVGGLRSFTVARAEPTQHIVEHRAGSTRNDVQRLFGHHVRKRAANTSCAGAERI